MAVEFSPRVAQETGGFGFQVPIFRMNQGINAATASPQARQSMTPADFAMEDFRVSPEDYQASLNEEARAGLDQGLLELNDLVSKAAMAGIDATKIDMSNPASIAVNQMFRKKFQDVKNLSKDIRTGVAQQKIELDRVNRDRDEERYQYLMKVERPEAERQRARSIETYKRQDEIYLKNKNQEDFEKRIGRFAPQLKSYLGMDLNNVRSESVPGLKARKAFLSKQLTSLRDAEPDGPVKDMLNEYLESVENVSYTVVKDKNGGGGIDPTKTYEQNRALTGNFTQKTTIYPPMIDPQTGKQITDKQDNYLTKPPSEVLKFVIRDDGKIRVYLKVPQLAPGEQFAYKPDGTVYAKSYVNENILLDPNVPRDMRDIETMIEKGYSDSEDGKLAKAMLYDKIANPGTKPAQSAAQTKVRMTAGSKGK